MSTRSTKKPVRVDSQEEITQTVDRLWITVGPFSVLLNRTREGLIVDVWEKGVEDGDPIDTMSIMNPEQEDEVP